MTPFVEGQIFAEVEHTMLPSLVFDILLAEFDPRLLRQISIARHYLASVRPATIRVAIIDGPGLPPEDNIPAGWAFRRVKLPDDVPDNVAKETRGWTEDLQKLVAAGLQCNVDFVCSEAPMTEAEIWAVDPLHAQIGNADSALRSIETFLRGHDLAWSFRRPMWYGTFTSLYPFSEPVFEKLNAFHNLVSKAAKERVELQLAESYARNLAFSTLFALAYSRDKLLFYIQQRRRAQRQGAFRQDFTLEIAYFLNHYYLLFWTSVDQLCWIMNYVFALGFSREDPEQRKAVGVTGRFTKALKQVDADAAAIFSDPDFVRWRRILRAARHHAAHHGITIPAEMYIKPDKDVTDGELDKEIDAEGELEFLKDMKAPQELVETFRSTIRIRKRQQRYENLGVILMLEEGGKQSYIFPLRHTWWDFEQFFKFADKVLSSCSKRLT